MSSKLGKQFLQFAMVGGLGTVTNLAIIFIGVDLLGYPWLAGATVAFAVAMTQNYVLNAVWTFQRDGESQLAGRRFAKFAFFSLLALGINLSVLGWLIQHYTFPSLAEVVQLSLELVQSPLASNCSLLSKGGEWLPKSTEFPVNLCRFTEPLTVIPAAVGIGAATLFNFSASRLVTFR